jgi:CheY-like chemotaxis protein
MKTILVVEDEVTIAEIVRWTLEDAGYQVITAPNGRVALDCLAQTRPDLVLCDIMMPILDGRQVCRAIQENPAYRSIPVIVMTAAIDAISRNECAWVARLNKPFNLDRMVETIQGIIGPPG